MSLLKRVKQWANDHAATNETEVTVTSEELMISNLGWYDGLAMTPMHLVAHTPHPAIPESPPETLETHDLHEPDALPRASARRAPHGSDRGFGNGRRF